MSSNNANWVVCSSERMVTMWRHRWDCGVAFESVDNYQPLSSSINNFQSSTSNVPLPTFHFQRSTLHRHLISSSLCLSNSDDLTRSCVHSNSWSSSWQNENNWAFSIQVHWPGNLNSSSTRQQGNVSEQSKHRISTSTMVAAPPEGMPFGETQAHCSTPVTCCLVMVSLFSNFTSAYSKFN